MIILSLKDLLLLKKQAGHCLGGLEAGVVPDLVVVDSVVLGEAVPAEAVPREAGDSFDNCIFLFYNF